MIEKNKENNKWNSTSTVFMDYLPWEANHDRLLQLISILHIDNIWYTKEYGHSFTSTPYDESIFLIPNILSTMNPKQKSLEHSINPYHEYMSKLHMLLNYPARCSIIAYMYMKIINEFHHKHVMDECWAAIWISAVVVAIRVHTTVPVKVDLIERLYNVKKGSLKKPIKEFLRLVRTTPNGIGISQKQQITAYFYIRSYYMEFQESQESWQKKPISPTEAKRIIKSSPITTKVSQDDHYDVVSLGRYVIV